MIFSAYRRDDFADPEMFLLQVGTVLERYTDAVIGAVSSPITGIQRRCKFPPTIAELVEACDHEQERAERIRQLGQLKLAAREPRASQHRANVFVPMDAPQYAAMVERARTADPQDYRHDGLGIWVGCNWLWGSSSTIFPGFRQFTVGDLEALYRKAEAGDPPEPDYDHAERLEREQRKLDDLLEEYR